MAFEIALEFTSRWMNMDTDQNRLFGNWFEATEDLQIVVVICTLLTLTGIVTDKPLEPVGFRMTYVT